MTGAFQTNRELFANPIWKNIVEFRLFFLIYGNAVYSKDGVRMADDLILKRGEWCRSTRKLQEDLQYIENRQVKTYSTSVINRCIKRLEKSQRIYTRIHELGTVFTVINYEQYQGFGGLRKDNLEQNLEHSGNSDGTVEEQQRNNNKNDNNDKNKKPSSRNKKTVYPEDSPYYKIAVYFKGKLDALAESEGLANLAPKANMQSWANDFRLMVEKDGHSDKNLILAVMDWVVTDPFWKTNVLSGGTFRNQFPKLVMKMNGQKVPVKSSSSRQEKNKELLNMEMQEARNEQRGNIEDTFTSQYGLPYGGTQ